MSGSDGEGIIDMNAGPDVCGRIKVPQKGHGIRENIFSGHYCRTKVMSVGPERGNNEKKGHAGKQKGTDPVVFLPVF